MPSTNTNAVPAARQRHAPAPPEYPDDIGGVPGFRVRGRLVRVAQPEGDGFLFLDNPERAVAHLRAQGPRADLVTFIQALPDAAPKFPYPFEMDNFATLRVNTFEDWWERGIGFKARNKFRQAEKRGVEIREIPFDDDAARGIWEIYNETPIRQGRRFPHYGKDLETVRRMSATFPDLSVFIGAFFEGRMIGFVKLVANQAGTQAGLMHILSLEAHRDKAPTNGLLAHAVRASAERGIAYLTYASLTYGNKERSTLSDFKVRCGFQRMDVPRYYVPLTRWGAMAYRLGLHRGLKDRLPESIAAPLRDARASWLRRKYGAAG
jgi:hypothetical protein